ncbi:unnamed protein product [Schistosoma margrebowiei]|uniref:Uncharacterized protein n=1 Tax=Schistosoma margrebowiei TaxID=48269 RepID=A0A183LP24_9TREM|nr:unnamed protein product [Schistosoma margrebowiei]
MQQRVCPNQLYMFDPGSKFFCQSVSRSALSGSLKLNHTFNAKKFHPACWAEVRGTVGSVPSARDGHSATVLEDAMFIFGGFDDVVSFFTLIVTSVMRSSSPINNEYFRALISMFIAILITNEIMFLSYSEVIFKYRC